MARHLRYPRAVYSDHSPHAMHPDPRHATQPDCPTSRSSSGLELRPSARAAAAHTYRAPAGHPRSFPPQSSNPSYYGLGITQVPCLAPDTDPRYAMYPFSRYAMHPDPSLGARWREERYHWSRMADSRSNVTWVRWWLVP